ncbi:MAG TPA: DUF4232 domain-containing protein [Streptosporangiaceae bacterium]|nr:DUF4232 domain-containing protein [Streptosporangiaceae bacterium]
MPGTKLAARHVFVILTQCAALGLIGLSAAACGLQSRHQAGSSHPAAGVTQSPSSGSSTSAGGPCITSELKVSLDIKSAGVAAGTSLIPLNFTNVGTASCQLSGFADVSFVTSSSGHQIGPAATVDRSLSPQSLRLGAGSSAHLWLRLVQAADLPTSTCKPKTVAGLQVRLPGQATSIFVAHQFTTCAKRVHGTDILTVEPFKAGLARAGTAQ